MERRQLLQSALCALWSGVGCSPAPPEKTEPAPTAAPLPMPLQSVGLQLYTVRDLLQQNPLDTLTAVANLGYRKVEFAGYAGLAPAEWKMALDDLGLVAPAAHFHIDIFQNAFEATLQNALTLGHEYLVLSFVPHELRSAEGYRQVAAVLNAAGAIAAQSGVLVGFHNHDFDFAPLEGETTIGYDILLAELDPALVQLELDVYWINITNHSAVDYFQRHPGRFRMCHLKDIAPLGTMADVGYGTIDWVALLGAAQTAGVVHHFVEHDVTSDPLASARRSFNYLSGAV